MAGRKSDFTLPTLDDLFSTQEIRDEAKLAKIRDIPIDLIDDFPDHPYKVRDDEDMMQLVESIKVRGVITPATVRQKEDGRYELISGHRRKRASELAGFDMLRCEVVELDRDEATILMVESNLQRSVILPSEKAFAYKMRLDAMKRKAGRPSKENAVFIEADGMTYSVENKAGVGFVNNAMTGSLKIIKTSSDGKVEGFSFRVTGPNGYDKTFVTDKNGEILIEGLRIGEYTVSEVVDGVSSAYSRPSDKKANVMTDSTTIVEIPNLLSLLSQKRMP